ncbi:MAG: ATP-binding cassette domain-containing protein, partial [Pseudomonadota bacterium]
LGFVKPDAGRIEVVGARPGSHAARPAVAYLPESVAFHKALTGREVTTLYARLKGVARGEVGDALARVGLADAAGRRVGTYSKGMRQRLGLVQALLGAPQGTAVMLASHSLDEIEARTDRVAILNKGVLVADAPLAALHARAALPIRIRVSARPDRLEEVSARLGGRRVNGHTVEVDCLQSDKVSRLASIGALADLVVDVDVAPPSLSDVYRHFSGSLADGGAP